MSKVIFCRGIQGSGKSTWAKEYVANNSKDWIRINWDDLREMMGPYWVPSRESLLTEISKKIFLEALIEGYNVVIDNMNLSKRSISCFIGVIMQFEKESFRKVTVEYKDFKTPLEECITRDAKREHPIGEKIIRETYERHKDFYGN